MSYKEELYTKWDEFWSSEDEKTVVLGLSLQEFIKEIKEPDAEDFYLWGLAVYTLNQDMALENSHSLFIKALGKDEDYYLARLYSAHCYHDKGHFDDALSEYLKVDQDLLKKDMPIWRWVKLLEQIGFCHVKIGQLKEGESYFTRVIDAYQTIDKNELVSVQEVYKCLPPEHPQVVKLKEAEKEHFTE